MYYQIRVRGELDPSWQTWFDWLQIRHEPEGTTVLLVSLPDQAALHGMVLKIVRLGLTLLELQLSEREHQPLVTSNGYQAMSTTETHPEFDLQSNYGVKSGYATANGLEMYYEEYGTSEKGRLPLILLHGGTATLKSWQEHIPAFVADFRVIALDSRGHGKTNNPAGELNYSMMADDVAAFVHALGLSNPLVFGYSDGGQIALELGIRYPDLLKTLVLGGTCYRFPDQYFDALKGFGISREGTRTVERLQAEEPDWVETLRAEHAREDDPDYWKTLMEQISTLWWNVQNYELADLKKISVPTLILQGDRDEGVAVEQAVEMYRAIPNSELAVLPNASHGDLGEVSNRLVVDFLKRQTTHPVATQTTKHIKES